MSSVNFKGSFISNRFVTGSSPSKYVAKNPYNHREILFEWSEGSSLVDEAISCAKKAKAAWKNLGIQGRVKILEKLKDEFKKRASAIEESIILETGKARWEAKQEASALAAKIDITIQSVPALLEAFRTTAGVGKDTDLIWLPRGICAVIGPFNFPLHLANGHIIPALLTGNVVIFKPSEASVGCASLYCEAVEAAGFPEGAFQMIAGGPELGRRLVEAEEIEGIFFTGSYASGKSILKNLIENRNDLSPLAALEMGGKNATVIAEDADLKKALSEVIVSAYATAGQRCSSTSRLLVHKNVFSQILGELKKLIPQMKVGNPADAKTFMGPLIHDRALQNFLKGLELARSEGFSVVIDSERIKSDSSLVSPSLFTMENVEKAVQCKSFQEEFFGPNILLVPFSNNEELIRLHEATPYGLVASVFTNSDSFFNLCAENFNVGLLNLNRGTVGASSKLPFGGFKKSGNNWPAGLSSFLYCIKPQSRLLESSQFEAAKIPEPIRDLFA